MSLDPEKVADLLLMPLNTYLKGDWYRNGATAIAIEEKALGRATSVASFVEWLMAQTFFMTDQSLNRLMLEKELLQLLAPCDALQIPDHLRAMTHKILYLESDSNIPGSMIPVLTGYAKNILDLDEEQFQVTLLQLPPKKQLELLGLLKSHTGSLLHNLSLDDLSWINGFVKVNPELARRMVIIRRKTELKEKEIYYQKLERAGVMMVTKPIESPEEVTRVLLGIV